MRCGKKRKKRGEEKKLGKKKEGIIFSGTTMITPLLLLLLLSTTLGSSTLRSQIGLLKAAHRTVHQARDASSNPYSSSSSTITEKPQLLVDSSSSNIPLKLEYGLSQTWGGVHGTGTINPGVVLSSATEAHSRESANGNGIGLMPKMKPSIMNQALFVQLD